MLLASQPSGIWSAKAPDGPTSATPLDTRRAQNRLRRVHTRNDGSISYLLFARLLACSSPDTLAYRGSPMRARLGGSLLRTLHRTSREVYRECFARLFECGLAHPPSRVHFHML